MHPGSLLFGLLAATKNSYPQRPRDRSRTASCRAWRRLEFQSRLPQLVQPSAVSENELPLNRCVRWPGIHELFTPILCKKPNPQTELKFHTAFRCPTAGRAFGVGPDREPPLVWGCYPYKPIKNLREAIKLWRLWFKQGVFVKQGFVGFR